MRLLILFLLVAGLAGYLIYQRSHNYPVQTIIAPNGHQYEGMQVPDRCQGQTCMHQVVYLTALEDTVGIKVEAEGLLHWLEPRITDSQPPQLVAIYAVKPGFLRIAPARRIVQLGYGREPPGAWKYLGAVDATAKLKALLK